MMSSSLGSIKVLSSGSSGNCLVLYDSKGNYLIVDVGLTWDKIAKGINYELRKCAGVLSSHRHKDHAKSLSKFIDLGVHCFGNEDLCDRYKGCILLDGPTNIGTFIVTPMTIPHDVPNTAFIIDTQDNIRVLYVTDAHCVNEVVPNVDVAIIEANWDADVMFDNAMNGCFIESQFNNHLGLDACIEYLRKIDNPKLQTIVLWHLSNTNIAKQVALEKVRNSINVPNVVVATSGLTIPLNNYDKE